LPFCVHLEGEAQFNRRGEQITLRTGDVFITDSREEFTLDLDRPWRHLVTTLPTGWIDSRVSKPDFATGAVLRGQPLVRLWARYLASGFAPAGELSPVGGALFVRDSVELLHQMLEEAHSERPTQSAAWQSATFLAACEVIALKYVDPNLTPDQIAQDVNVSTRTLQRMFAANNQTIMRRVLDERVRQAARMLTAPQSAPRSVTEIAFACGFADPSHFGRVFAVGMGMPPSDWRRRNQ
jgi:AraC-like DNA-binding protein